VERAMTDHRVEGGLELVAFVIALLALIYMLIA
jgi:hypothetical protein